jgi:hypothetical protein
MKERVNKAVFEAAAGPMRRTHAYRTSILGFVHGPEGQQY